VRIIVYLFPRIFYWEVEDLNKLLATFSKQVVEITILLYSLERKVDLGKQILFYCMREMELKPI
jgi:hypothetical protein